MLFVRIIEYYYCNDQRRKMRWAEHVACVGLKCVQSFGWKRRDGPSRCRWVEELKSILKK